MLCAVVIRMTLRIVVHGHELHYGPQVHSVSVEAMDATHGLGLGLGGELHLSDLSHPGFLVAVYDGRTPHNLVLHELVQVLVPLPEEAKQ